MKTYTMFIRNEMLGSSRYRGTFATEEEAREACKREARNARSFATFEVWTGSPQAPGKPIDDSRVRGVA